MGRGVSAGGGQSSLGYLFGNGESPKPDTQVAQDASNNSRTVSNNSPPKPKVTQAVDINKQIPAGIQSSAASNHIGADGKNTCNYISDRPSTKIHAAPGGGSSLGYLFGGGSN